MSEQMKPGTIGWVDLTVDDASGLRDFYARVAGWKPEPVPMGGYDDFNMTHPETGVPVARWSATGADQTNSCRPSG